MHIPLAQRLRKVSPSSTLAITAKARKLKSEGCDIVSFAAGEPDFDTPQSIKDAAIEAIRSGFTKYTPTAGIPELKKLISEKFRKDNGLDYAPDDIVVSCGAKHSIFNVLMVLIDRGDEVVIPAPYWVSYPEMVMICEGIPRIIPTSRLSGYKMAHTDLSAAITSKTKLLILNSPSNPAGCVYSREELQRIAEVCLDKKIFVLSDEIYEKLTYDGQRHVSIAGSNSGIFKQTITVNGFSKSYSMTGWRLGYMGAPKEIAGAVSNLQDHSTSNPSSISQKGAVAALGMAREFFDTTRSEFEKRRDYCLARLDAIPEITYCRPQGAFYIFVDISKTGLKDAAFAGRFLEEKYVSVIPGGAFGSDNHVRISFAADMEQLKKGMDRLEEFVRRCH